MRLIARVLIRVHSDKHTSAHSPELAGLRALGRYAPCRACLREIAAEQRQFLQRAGTSCPALGAPPATFGLLFEDRFTGGQPASSFRPSPGYSLASGQPLLRRGGTRLPAPSRVREAGRCPQRAFAGPGPLRGPGSSVKTRRLPQQAAACTGATGPHPNGSAPTSTLRSGLVGTARCGGSPDAGPGACHSTTLLEPLWSSWRHRY